MEEKIDPWGDIRVEDYKDTIDKFGIEDIEDLDEKIPDHRLFRRNIVFGHRDFGKILEAIDKGKDFSMMTVMMP